MFEYVKKEKEKEKVLIKIMGVGGAGCNAVGNMIANNLHGVDYLSVNTDKQVLDKYSHRTLQIGSKLTHGFGAGANPDIGRKAAEEDIDGIERELKGVDMLFISAGMGGGTGTGATPIIANLARSLGILTVAVVTTPFKYEGLKRNKIAELGLQELEKEVDSLIVVPNEKLLLVLGEACTVKQATKESDSVLFDAVKGIYDLVAQVGFINNDFADLKAVMQVRGRSIMAIGTSQGEDRAKKATEAALSCPLLDRVDLSQAKAVMINITADESLTLLETSEINGMIEDLTHEEIVLISGNVIDSSMGDTIKVSVIATGLRALNDSASFQEQGDCKEATEPNSEFRLESPNEKKYVYPNLEMDRINGKKIIMSEEECKQIEKTDYNKPAYIRRQAN